MTRTTQSYARVMPFGDSIEELAHRARGTAELHDAHGVVFGVAHWRPGPRGERWYARAIDNASVMTVGETVEIVTRQLARKIERGR